MSSRSFPLSLERHVALGLIASLVLHLGLVIVLLSAPERAPVLKPLAINVSFVKEPPGTEPPVQRQIVSEPSSPTAAENENTNARFLAERAHTAEKEQIKRGDGNEAGVPGPRIPPAVSEKPQAEVLPRPERAPKAPAQQKALSPKEPRPKAGSRELKELTLDPALALQKFGAATANRFSEGETLLDPRSYQAFSRPSGSGAAFLGMPGTNDYLPQLPDGDITMLNTKASHFAVFVRRVATQVFSQLRRAGWDQLATNDILAINDFSTVEATLSLAGEFIDARLSASSGSRRFDQVVLEAARKGTRDPNPPKDAAASDGTIHFIFKAKSWARVRSDPRSGALEEARWLLLGTGLE